MRYIGIQAQQWRNNFRSLLLLILFPVLVAALTYAFCHALAWFGTTQEWSESSPYLDDYGRYTPRILADRWFMQAVPLVMGAVLVWFAIAWFANTAIIRRATQARPLERTENKRVYNLVENLCMAQGMPMPKVNVIEDSSLNAFASGIDRRSYTVTLTRGIIDRLDDDELEGVIAHELSHIRHRDVRLLIVSIVFVGIFTMIAQVALRMLLHGRFRSRGKNGGGVVVLLLLLAVLAGIGYFFATMMRFAISRRREYLADAGASSMTRKPLALAGALRKISGDPEIESVKRDDVAQLFIQHPRKKRRGFSSLFATHPPIDRRIEVLEQF